MNHYYHSIINKKEANCNFALCMEVNTHKRVQFSATNVQTFYVYMCSNNNRYRRKWPLIRDRYTCLQCARLCIFFFPLQRKHNEPIYFWQYFNWNVLEQGCALRIHSKSVFILLRAYILHWIRARMISNYTITITTMINSEQCGRWLWMIRKTTSKIHTFLSRQLSHEWIFW